jgi:ATP-binding cassette, subfamily C (CFTR/MRP), member 1
MKEVQKRVGMAVPFYFSIKLIVVQVTQLTRINTGITSTMLGNMKSIKASGLSQKISSRIDEMRATEMKTAIPFRLISVCTATLAQIPILISPVAAFAAFSAIALRAGETLEATRLFSAFSLIILLTSPLFSTFEVIFDLFSALACFDRIQNFLFTQQRHDYRNHLLLASGRQAESAMTSLPSLTEPHETRIQEFELTELTRTQSHSLVGRNREAEIEVLDASFSWSSEEAPTVRGINMTVPRGNLVVIVGPIASGKSTLLKGVLGEVPVASGSVNLQSGRTSWCDQTPWLKVFQIALPFLP